METECKLTEAQMKAQFDLLNSPSSTTYVIRPMENKLLYGIVTALCLAVILCLVIIWSSVAKAEVTCQQVGNYTYCWDSSTGRQITCQQVGNYTYCN